MMSRPPTWLLVGTVMIAPGALAAPPAPTAPAPPVPAASPPPAPAAPAPPAPAPPAPAPPAPASTAPAAPAPTPPPAGVTDVPAPAGAGTAPVVTDVVPPAPRSAPAEAPPPFSTEPPAPSARVHDGLYLGFQSGPAYFSATSEWEVGAANAPGSREFRGPSLSFWFALGGTFAKRIVLAGIVMLEPVLSLSAQDEFGDNLEVEDVSFFLRGEGLLLDYYLSPAGGFHLVGSLGFAQLDVDRSNTNGDDPDDPTGSFWSLGAGYDWWTGDSASIGVLARVTNASLESHETSEDVDVEAFSFGLHVTATMN